MQARYFALVMGVVYLAVGALGFIPGTHPHRAGAPDLAVDAGYGYLLGLFPINVLHNLVHLLIGALGIAAYLGGEGAARNFARGLAVFYGLLAVMGLIPGLNTTFGLIPIFGHDVWLHALSAAAAAYFGFAAPRGTARAAGRA
jgi:hypothetical protein